MGEHDRLLDGVGEGEFAVADDGWNATVAYSRTPVTAAPRAWGLYASVTTGFIADGRGESGAVTPNGAGPWSSPYGAGRNRGWRPARGAPTVGSPSKTRTYGPYAARLVRVDHRAISGAPYA